MTYGVAVTALLLFPWLLAINIAVGACRTALRKSTGGERATMIGHEGGGRTACPRSQKQKRLRSG